MHALSRRKKSLAALLAAAGVTASVALAGAATQTTYPDADGWTFATGPEGWTSTLAECRALDNLTVTLAPVCATTNEHRADNTGSIWTSFATLANAAGALEGRGIWQSPTFTVVNDAAVPDTQEIADVTLSYERRLQFSQLLAQSGSRVRSTVLLVQKPTPTTERETVLLTEELTIDDKDKWITRTRSVGATAVQPGGTYSLRFRSVLTSDDGQLITGKVEVGYDNVKLVVTPPVVGPAGATCPAGLRGQDGATCPTGPAGADGQSGATGPTGPAGADGQDGQNGQNGTNGTNGQDGAQGPAGPQGAQDPAGPAGPAGAPGQPGREASVVNSDEARRLLRIDRLVKLQTRGRFRDQLRTRIYCRGAVDERCEGVVKIRTVNKVNTAFLPGRKFLRRVTLGTGSYRLNRLQTGYAKFTVSALTRKIIRVRGPLKVDVFITVLDENRQQQTLRKRFTLSAAK